MLAMQRTAGNRAVGWFLARKVKQSGTNARLLEKADRLGFEKNLEDKMPVAPGQHRAHVISYDTLALGVMDSINKCITTADTDWMNAVYNLIAAVFPGGSHKSWRYPGTPLEQIATGNHLRAENHCRDIKTLLANGKDANHPDLVKLANDLISALNNSPDNLRTGDGPTNSSIGNALDLEPNTANPYETLKKGAQIVDPATMLEDTYKTVSLPQDTEVLRVTPLNEWMVWRMLTATWSQRNELKLYSSGKQLQSSNYTGMVGPAMTKLNATHVAIQVPNTNNFFLFTLPA
jgi:hypothetical protein